MLQVVRLNALNRKTNLSEDEKRTQGFVSWTYELDLLQKMNACCPSIIAMDGEILAGYALVAVPEARSFHNELDLLLKKIEAFPYLGKPIQDYAFYMIGQLCVAKEYRGLQLSDKMYEFHQQYYQSRFDIMVTTVVLENARSIRVHERAGFDTISDIEDHFGTWRVIGKRLR